MYQVWTGVDADSLRRDARQDWSLLWPPGQDIGKNESYDEL